MKNEIRIETTCETIIKINNTTSGLYATFSNMSDTWEITQFWEIGAINLWELIESIKEYAEENEIDLY